jgi:hypothetical protein
MQFEVNAILTKGNKTMNKKTLCGVLCLLAVLAMEFAWACFLRNAMRLPKTVRLLT